MQGIIDKVNLILKLEKYGINLDFVKTYGTEVLDACCDKLAQHGIPKEIYEENKALQNVLISEEKFSEYLLKFHQEEIAADKIVSIINQICDRNEKVTDFSVDKLMNTLEKHELEHDFFYDYLKYTYDKELTSDEDCNLIENLNYLRYLRDKKSCFYDLPEAARRLFLKPYIYDSCLIPLDVIKYNNQVLTGNEAIFGMIDFFYTNDIEISIDYSDYMLIEKNAAEISVCLKAIFSLVNNDALIMTSLCDLWLENKCSLYDLQTLIQKIPTVSPEEFELALSNRSSYINFIFGNKISKIPLNGEPSYREEILIYAVVNNKKGFIKLVEENHDVFVSLSHISILFDSDFYEKYVNINSLSRKNLLDCAVMFTNKFNISLLSEASYTFSEIKALYGLHNVYFKLYNMLNVSKVDDKILTLRQLAKKKLLPEALDDLSLERLAQRLSIKPIYKWIQDEFSKISDVNANITIDILINYEKLDKFIPCITTAAEANYLIRNKDSISECKSFDYILKNIDKIDVAWSELYQILELSDTFREIYFNNIIKFLMNDGAQIAVAYFKNLDSDKKEAFKLIVKAELMGEFHKLKYFEDDLLKEVEYLLLISI